MSIIQASPVCTVNAKLPPQTVAAGSTVIIALQNPYGVLNWYPTCLGTDELSNPATINAQLANNINLGDYTTSYVQPSTLTGSAIIIQSVVNDNDGNTFTTTFKVKVLSQSGSTVGAKGETVEDDPTGFGNTTMWNQGARAGFSAPTGPAGGDLSATYPGPKVTGIQSVPVSSTAPTAGQVLQYVSGKWTPENLTAVYAAGGDLSGTSTTQTVISISGPSPVAINTANLQFSNTVSPIISQNADGINSSVGQTFSINAQNKPGTNTTGGTLSLNAGSGTSSNGIILLGVNNSTAFTVNVNPAGPVGFTAGSSTTGLTINQTSLNATGTGAALTISAQSYTGAGSTGGALILSSGAGVANPGVVSINAGSSTVVHTQSNNQFTFPATVSNPVFGQDATSTGSSSSFTIQAQNNSATSSTGGLLTLSSGSGTSANGNIALTTGSTSRIIVDPHNTTINGGILYNIRTTTISTTLDITAPYDGILLVNASGTVNIQLPNPAINNGRQFTIIDITGNFSNYTVTLVRYGSEKINRQASNRILSAGFGQYIINCNGIDWFTI